MMPRDFLIGVVLAVGSVFPVIAHEEPADQAPSDYVLRARRLSVMPAIDGRMDETAWEEATVADGFTQLVPQEGAAATERTEVRVGYDDANLYLGFRCFDSEPNKVVATVLKRDEDLTVFDDYVEVILDTYHDGQSGFLFATNALGAKMDALVRKEGEEVNLAWDGLWEVAGSRDAEGWTAEFRIPFNTLRFPEAKEQTWGLNFERAIARKREETFWKPLQRAYGYNAKYKISEFGQITSLTDLKQGAHILVRPHVTGETGDAVRRDERDSLQAGLDVKMNLASNLVGDLTYKTDFAEVEADEQQINLTRFKLFYPEKRPFFLEAAELFYFGERPEPYKSPETMFFFSRQIGLNEDGSQEIPVLGGAKVTSKVSGLGIGFLNITTEKFQDPSGTLAPRTNYSVLRLRQDVGENSSVGFMGLNKTSDDGYNRGLGTDWDFQLRDSLRTGGFVAKTYTPGLEGDDWAASSDIYWDSKHSRARVAYSDIGEDFNAEMGFLTRTGVRKLRTNLTGIAWPSSLNVRQVLLVHYLDYITDRQGAIQSRVNTGELSVIFQNSSGFALKYFNNREVLTSDFEIHRGVVIPPGTYDFGNIFFGFQTDYTKALGGAGWLQGGEFYDGTLFMYLGAATWRPVRGLLSQLVYQHTKVDLEEGDFTTDLVNCSVDYALRPDLTTRALIQWRKEEEEEDFRANIVLNWAYRPGANLYLVYNGTQTTLDGISWQKDRSIAVKLTYLFDF